MDYKRCNDCIAVRIDRGEEILENLKTVCLKENVKCAHIQGLGAASEVILGVFKPEEKKYYSSTFVGDYEITTIVGNISSKDGEYYSHVHITIADEKGCAFGGHLNKAVIGGTCEIFITVLPCSIGRKVDPATGLNVFDFQ